MKNIYTNAQPTTLRKTSAANFEKVISGMYFIVALYYRFTHS